MYFLLTGGTIIILLQHISLTLSSTSTWPDCYKQGVDWTGDDLLDGLRFSKEACAEWCESMSTRCVGWVYKDKGSWCHLKYIKGMERNLNNPLTSEEIKKVEEDCKKNPPSAPAAPSSSGNSADASTNATSSNDTSSSSSGASTGTTLCDYSANDTWYSLMIEY